MQWRASSCRAARKKSSRRRRSSRFEEGEAAASAAAARARRVRFVSTSLPPQGRRVTSSPKKPSPAAPHQPPQRSRPVPSRYRARRSGFRARSRAAQRTERSAAQFRRSIPESRESSTKSYAFDVPVVFTRRRTRQRHHHASRSWQRGGRDCYYGRYEFTYPDGAMESGSIVWPFCFDPSSDPFKEPPHPIPFPLPLLGFKLPADAQLPPIEKSVYEAWAAGNGTVSAP